VCDGDSRSCTELNPSAFKGGVAPCRTDCRGYDLGGCVTQAPPTPPQLDIEDAVNAITEAQLKQDLTLLAGDNLSGRYPGSAGDQKTQDHIAKVFSAAGLNSGKGSAYRQTFTWSGKQTANMVGVLPGTDFQLKDQVVIVGAHHDHLGSTSKYGCSNKGGNSICNGADDNGTGTVAVLALARALAKLKGQNKRTLVFMTFGAEEKGLVGSAYYVKQEPLYPLSKTVYMINIDMIGDSSGSVSALGAGKSQLASSWLKAAAQKHGITAKVTYSAGSGSDHYHFALANVPYVFFHTGISACYHATCDTVEKIHYPQFLKITQAVARLMWKLSQESQNPRSDFQTTTVSPTAPQGWDNWMEFQQSIDHQVYPGSNGV
jgi:acetylornithine deacetylase/succinyl-diaminopimelate desuccinylase-like protein